MPLYEYECQSCGYRFEQLQTFSDKALKICPKCSCPALKKCISIPSFKLKGDGWYETDFKNKGKKPDKPDSDKKKPDEKKDIKPGKDSVGNKGRDNIKTKSKDQ